MIPSNTKNVSFNVPHVFSAFQVTSNTQLMRRKCDFGRFGPFSTQNRTKRRRKSGKNRVFCVHHEIDKNAYLDRKLDVCAVKTSILGPPGDIWSMEKSTRQSWKIRDFRPPLLAANGRVPDLEPPHPRPPLESPRTRDRNKLDTSKALYHQTAPQSDAWSRRSVDCEEKGAPTGIEPASLQAQGPPRYHLDHQGGWRVGGHFSFDALEFIV